MLSLSRNKPFHIEAVRQLATQTLDETPFLK